MIATDVPPSWVVWHADAGETLVFDLEYNVPVDLDEPALGEVLRLMIGSGAPQTGEYPGRACA
ncbi:hypothetical protein ACN20G_01245 [Streptomyces sp. BI20]|uniref:hypothetical protein n=1 Tax=Streptomyces sp. BI20 TaxID=3403460 RepID=UPI003C77FC93